MLRACLMLVALAFAGAVGAAASEGQACPHAPAILAASDAALREPAELPTFWRDRIGHDAAYLRIRYGGLDALAGDALLSRLEARRKPPERMLELRLSHARTEDRAARIALIEHPPRDGTVLPSLGGSVLRALVLEDGGGWLVAEAKRWLDAQPESPLRQTFAISVARSIADAHDAAKSAFADEAEAAGLWSLAFAAHAVRDDLAGLVGLLDRAPDGALGDPGQDPAGWRAGMLRFALTLAEMRDGFDMAAQPPEVQALDGRRPYARHFRDMYRLVARTPDTAMLLTLLNQTGEMRLATELTPELLAAIADGRLDPVLHPAGMIAAVVDGLDRVLGREARERDLDSFQVVAGSPAARAEQASAFADRMIARHALASLVSGAAAVVERPAALTRAYDWDGMHRVAAALASGAPVDEADRLVAADLLAGAARFDEAAAMLSRSADVVAAQPAAHALALMLDRACLGALVPPLPLGESVFRFHPR